MITPADIAAAIANPATPDIPTLERAFNAFALYPAGEGLSGFAGVPDMIRAFTDGVCVHLTGDHDPLPTETYDTVAEAVMSVGGWMSSGTYDAAATAVIRHWPIFGERISAVHPA